jgi:hypothetical protein
VRQPVESSNSLIQQTRPSTATTDHPLYASQVRFVRDKRGRYIPLSSRLRNDLSPSVGFLEFANACDFAANVWNTIPVPTYAAVLMGLGGTFALAMAGFALLDAIRSWHNIAHLRQERRRLRICRQSCKDEAFLDARLEVNRREIGIEVIDRFTMDTFMGFGSLLIGVGTLMAIKGANRRVFFVSNLLSGYFGNTPPAVWGLANTIWCTHLWRRANRHLAAGSKVLNSEVVTNALKPRINLIKWHTMLMGVTTLVAGAGSLVTATRWWGYVVLIPCIVVFVYDNFLWRNKLGYERSTTGQEEHWEHGAVEELEWVVFEGNALMQNPTFAEHSPQNINAAMSFIIRCYLFEELSIRLLRNGAFSDHALQLSSDGLRLSSEKLQASSDGLQASEKELTMTPQIIMAASDQFSPFILQTVESCILEAGVKQLRWKERFLLELVGSYLCFLEPRDDPPSQSSPKECDEDAN